MLTRTSFQIPAHVATPTTGFLWRSSAPSEVDPAEASRDEPERTDEADARSPAQAFMRVELPSALHASEPVAVFFQLSVLGALGGAYALAHPFALATAQLAQHLPLWSHLTATAAAACLGLALIERAKRDRMPVLALLNAAAALLVGLTTSEELLSGRATAQAWHLLLVGVGLAAAHLLVFEDWMRGQAGPGLRALTALAADLATPAWWVWSSKAALARRASVQQLRRQLKVDRASEIARRVRAEDAAAAAEAARKEQEHALAAARAMESAERSQRRMAEEQYRAADVRRRIAEAEARTCEARARIAQAQEDLGTRTRAIEMIRAEEACIAKGLLEVEARRLEAAMRVRALEEEARRHGIDVARTQMLLSDIEQWIGADMDGTELDSAVEGAPGADEVDGRPYVLSGAPDVRLHVDDLRCT